MKLVKSLLLGSAAGLVAVAGASAADLGVKKPTSVEYVKTCPQYGAGFFVVPGTTSCLRILGRVRVDYLFNNTLARVGAAGALGGDHNTFRTRGYLQADHRTASEYGLVRTFIRLWMGRDAGAGTSGNGGFQSTQNAVELAFIQFGGLTVGRATSIFEHGYSFNLVGSNAIGGFSDVFAINQAAYTFAFGGGFSASLAIESGAERRTALTGATYAGQAAPDVLASLDYSASWGSVKLAGALHQVREVGAAGVIAGTKFGYAVTGAAKFNLPFGAAGSNLWVNGTYAVGANSYAGFSGTAQTIGNRNYQFTDAVLGAGALQLTRTMAFSGGLQAFFTPTVYAGISGYYSTHDQYLASNTITTSALIGTVGWVPVAGLQFVGEVVYRTVRSGASIVPALPTGVSAATTVKRNDITGRIRVQRDF